MKNLNIPLSLRMMLAPLAFLLVMAIVVAAGFRFASQKITSLNSTLKQNIQSENTLRQKADLLSGVKENIIGNTNLAVAALPSDNPSLFLLSQLKVIAGQNGLVISGVKMSQGTISVAGLSNVSVYVDVEGASSQIVNLINSISTITPVSVLEKLDISFLGGNLQATIAVKSFWSPLPTKLPNITDAAGDLSTAEKDTLAKISKLTLPVFSNLLPSSFGIRDNPFGI